MKPRKRTPKTTVAMIQIHLRKHSQLNFLTGGAGTNAGKFAYLFAMSLINLIIKCLAPVKYLAANHTAMLVSGYLLKIIERCILSIDDGISSCAQLWLRRFSVPSWVNLQSTSVCIHELPLSLRATETQLSIHSCCWYLCTAKCLHLLKGVS